MRLGDIGTWLSGGTPSTQNPRYWNGDIPWISAASLRDFRIETSERRITQLGSLAGTRMVPKGTTIFVVRGMSLKNEFRIGIIGRDVAFGQDCKAIIPPSHIDQIFLGYAVKAQSERILRLVDEAGHGTGRLPTSQLADVLIGVPPLTEQRRIAEILESADRAIRSTERLVAKLEPMWQALLHDLLARGVHEYGGKRGGMSHHHTPWQFRELVDVLGRDFPGAWGGEPRKVGNVSVLRSTNLDDNGHINYQTGASRWFPKQEIEDKRLVDGDVLLEASGGGPGKPVGRVALFRDPGSQIFASSNFFRTLRPGPSIDGRFLARYLQWVYRQPIIWRFQQQTTWIINLKHREYLRQAVPVPPIAEQKRIVEILDEADETIQSTRRRLAKLREVKRGLMGDLLTGRVRVAEVEDTIPV